MCIHGCIKNIQLQIYKIYNFKKLRYTSKSELKHATNKITELP